MSQTDKPLVSARHKKACTECRQQKAKCDAYLNPDAPCSRCRKVGARCVISDPFKREHKRKRMSQLEHEAEELRKRLNVSNNSTNNNRYKIDSPIGVLNGIPDLSHTPQSLGSSSTMGTSPQSVDPLSIHQGQGVVINARPAPVVVRPTQNDETTLARMVKGVRVEGNEIDDIFQLFFQDYAPFLPVLDPNTTPNAYFDQSTLLFWTVTFVASRNYTKNLTLFPTLADAVTEMILLSMGTNSAPVFKIQSFLLFLTWPPPRLEIFFPLSGWLLHIAMQNGLHIPMASHEFGRNVRVSRSEQSQANKAVLMMDMQRRSELWAYCVIVYQRACLSKGQPPRAMLDLVPDSGNKLCRQLSPVLALQLRCLDVVSKCSVNIFTTGVRNTSSEHERSMTALIRAHETQMYDLVGQLPPNHNTLYPTIARLQIQVFYLYKDLTGPYDICFTRLTDTACSVIDHLRVLYDKPELYVCSPIFITNALVSASAILLRLLKSSMSSKIDAEKAKISFFAGISLLKHMVLDAKDLASKCAIALTQVWNSPKAFRKADGSEYATLRIRSRLVMSPVIELACWWREEFEMDDDDDAANDNTTNPAFGENEMQPNLTDTVNDLGTEFQFLNDEFLTDFEWAFDNEYLLPTEAYSDVAWLANATASANSLPPI
ncbi:C6 transcription factor (Leu3), putative [Talaromyces stipitatus ATCC 10500]|uniref:C6 transcription factor (Leu3), putative n=1 Tax=Talaromyces stipitatus (strain ATCC 10500 / CBS 375.48 / QM 6759 / NRRL 1006) TaxID=441959 RepID=B8MMB2_TALSN|nr:C6 transcription factor (Leu3), putative [Talaromyces stipitatus ATCC 10500]EED13666.1 C6 transcription factor (Leu3), putative [Talaromyces stipitatus ATCC 10500]